MSFVISSVYIFVIFLKLTTSLPTHVIESNDKARPQRSLYGYSGLESGFTSNQPILSPENDYVTAAFQPTPQPISPIYKSTIDFGSQDFSLDFPQSINAYIVGGRVLKPYEVMEKLTAEDDLILGTNNLLDSRKSLQLTGRSLFNTKSRFVSNFINARPMRPPPARPLFNQNHGPVALGSGSLGYIRLANGVIFIGSGSLGYINEQQFTQDVESRQQPPRQFDYLPGSPITFQSSN